MVEFGKVLTAMVTPFNEKLEVDYKRLNELTDRLLNLGSDGLVISGTTGESPTLTKEEKLEIFKTIRKNFKKPIIAGTGSYSTEDSIFLSKAAQEIGVDALLLVNPYYNKPSQEGLYQHFKTIAMSVDIPIILYNHPGRTGVCIEPETLERLAKIKNIVAIKDSSGNLSLISEYKRHTPKEFMIYSGDDPLTLPILSLGGYGVISVASHIAGLKIKEMITSFNNGNLEKSQLIHYQLWELFKVLFCAPSPAPTKEALSLIGFNVGGVRLPLVNVNETQREMIKKVITNLDI